MPKSKHSVKNRARVSKSQNFKLSKDLIIGIAIGAIVIFVICLMMIPGGQSSFASQ